MPSAEVSRSLLWLKWARKRLGPWLRHGRGVPDPARDGFSNADLCGYPNNHNYVIDDGRVIPSFDLFWRSSILSTLYTDPIESLLDIGSCKGWFVLDAASRSATNRAVGIDIYPPFVELAKKVADFRGCEGAVFHTAFLRELFTHPEKFGAPFRNILIINTYHYLFWGSNLSPERFGNHEEIIAGLAGICSDRVIFANPLSVADVPGETRRIAVSDPERGKDYTPDAFLAAAAKHFEVENHGTIGKRNLLVLHIGN